jgi:hypothetical protein
LKNNKLWFNKFSRFIQAKFLVILSPFTIRILI